MAALDVLVPSGRHSGFFRRSGWVAERNVERLRAEGHEVLVHTDDGCAESALLTREIGDGMAFFGHGHHDMLEGTDERPLFPGHGARRLAGRWVHALACDAGLEWALRIARDGAGPVVGYTGPLSPEWDERRVPQAIAAAFEGAVTAVTSSLAAGVTDGNALRDSMSVPRNTILLWAGSHPGEASALVQFCEQLYTSLRVTPAHRG